VLVHEVEDDLGRAGQRRREGLDWKECTLAGIERVWQQRSADVTARAADDRLPGDAQPDQWVSSRASGPVGGTRIFDFDPHDVVTAFGDEPW
jgi:hypothetical protein